MPLSLKQTIVTALLFSLGSITLAAQTLLPFTTDFSRGIPAGWSEESNDTISWEEVDTLGLVDAGSLVVDMGNNALPDTAFLRTERFNVSQVERPVLRATAALVQNNFVAPSLSLWYETVDGEWQRLVGWGRTSGTGKDSLIAVEISFNFAPALQRENLKVVGITFDLSEIGGRSDVRFELRAEIVNGGWVVLDNFGIASEPESGVEEALEIVPEEINLH